MTLRIGIITVQEPGYHPNRRLLEAAGIAGHEAVLIHPYRQWPKMVAGQLGVTAKNGAGLPHVVMPRQGAQVGDACLALMGQFQLMGVPMVNDHQAVSIARNKFITQQVLTAAGLPCPDTVFINHESGFFQAVDQLGGYPVVVKPVSGRQGDGVLLIMDGVDARRRGLPALNPQRGLMVQRYIPAEKRRDIRALVIGGALICAASLVPASGEFRANFHLGSEIRSTVLATDLKQIALSAAAVVGCDVAGVDIIVDSDGRPFIVEVNYSPGFKGLEAATGRDIAGRIIRFATDRYHEKRHPTDV
ncbi:RimK family alpha-L-glutamate ligase [Desulfosarcina sp.]|uniref:ATP-grasp domain-containing protein n=1 Tax=Desulfosarcina sp. TaxID=2027861 RepID=UPI00397075ED